MRAINQMPSGVENKFFQFTALNEKRKRIQMGYMKKSISAILTIFFLTGVNSLAGKSPQVAPGINNPVIRNNDRESEK